ncbi:hypothetical protein EVAR_74115_1 [Eumeta japonica]|uniref:Uncharacterized protein n=1 Tax=Eumeta variegata TaxID=151549 RepID=A0A4C1TU23_EUMVA|nr:hypothetical protein EVAR_74115_1 [Eumeta japonica]
MSANTKQQFLSNSINLTNTTNVKTDSERQRMLKLQRLEEEKIIQQEYLERKYKILLQTDSQCDEQISSQHHNSTRPAAEYMPNIPSVENNQHVYSAQGIYPTASQMEARRSIPRELPHFSGDPEDWPMFINSFETSTAIAGFSNAENLMRLQHCLKGKAREMVKSKLLIPALVPDVIRTLRLCFGRPEHILERVINKARTMPSPRDKLESIIEFAINVQNICATMESCGLESHLNNPMLVKELVDKLPNQHKLNWAMSQRRKSSRYKIIQHMALPNR